MPPGHRRTSATGLPVRLGQRIRALREERGIGQAELARLIGSSASHMNKLEAGLKAATVVTVESIASALQVEVADLFPSHKGGRPATNPPPDSLWVTLTGELRARDHDYLLLVRDAVKLLDRAAAALRTRPTR